MLYLRFVWVISIVVLAGCSVAAAAPAADPIASGASGLSAQGAFTETVPVGPGSGTVLTETVPIGSSSSTLADSLLKQAALKQRIQFNPGAAIQKRIFADGFVPNSPEFDIVFDNVAYTAQRAEELRFGKVRVYYVRKGDWANVQFVDRP